MSSISNSTKTSTTLDLILNPNLHKKSFEHHFPNTSRRNESPGLVTPRLTARGTLRDFDGTPTSTTSKGSEFSLVSPVTTGSPMPKLKFPKLFKEANQSVGLTNSKTAPAMLMHKALHSQDVEAETFIGKRKIGMMRLLLREHQINTKIEFDSFRNTLENYKFGTQNDSFCSMNDSEMLFVLKRYLKETSLQDLSAEGMLCELTYNCKDCVEDQSMVAQTCLKKPIVSQQIIEEIGYSYHVNFNKVTEKLFPLLDQCYGC